MLKRTYEGQVCSVAGTLELVGERWTILILRDSFLGVRRFDDFQRSLGVARNVLNDRLQKLCDEQILERWQYEDRPPRYEYRLTQKGIDLWPTVIQLMKWGDHYLFDDSPPVLVEHKQCGGLVDGNLTCEKCGEILTAFDTRALMGPGFSAKRSPVQPALAGQVPVTSKRRRKSVRTS